MAVKTYSHKYFNQLHSVCINKNVHYVCSTGLDLLLKFKDGYLISSWHPDHGNDISWLKDKDYRGINYHDLKINKHHVNYVFNHDNNIYICCGKSHKYYELDENLKVKRFIDLKCKYDGSNIIHDGLISNDDLLFTETTGLIHKWNLKTSMVTSKNIGIKWIRGLVKTKDGYCVGTSAVGSKASLIYLDNSFNILKELKINNSPIRDPQLYSIII